MWTVEATEDFRQWFESLPEPASKSVSLSVKLLEEFGPLLSRPHADTLAGSRFANMKELRVTAKRLAIRVAFAFDPDRKAILLVAGDKRGVSQRRFYRWLIAKADSLYTEHLARR